MKMEGRESASSLVAAASGRPTLDDQIDAAGLGWYQARLFAMLSLITVADGMEMTVLTMLRAPSRWPQRWPGQIALRLACAGTSFLNLDRLIAAGA